MYVADGLAHPEHVVDAVDKEEVGNVVDDVEGPVVVVEDGDNSIS